MVQGSIRPYATVTGVSNRESTIVFARVVMSYVNSLPAACGANAAGILVLALPGVNTQATTLKAYRYL